MKDLMLAVLLRAGRVKILAAAVALVVLTSLLDWTMGRNVSLAALYILPVMLGAVVWRPHETAAAALLCSYIRSHFDTAGSPAELTLRFVFAALAYFLSGLFVTELVRNHELVISHLAGIQAEQALRREAQEQLRLLAESSPAAILTTDGNGNVLAGNSAAQELFGIPEEESLRGRNIEKYVPVLAEALRLDVGRDGLRTAAQCQAYRENGEVFLAHMWFSCYGSEVGSRLAAIVVDSSEEMREREEQGLQQLMRGNRIAAAAVAHEVRNFCGAMAMLCENLRSRRTLAEDPDLQGLVRMVAGLQAIASLELQSKAQEALEQVSLRGVLNNLRILIEPDWNDIGGTIRWQLPNALPLVIAEPHGILQAFLNLAQNSHRAVQQCAVRELIVTVSQEAFGAVVRVRDSGPGVAAPERLFKPFQEGAFGTGMGLYVSRVLVRSYGGELRFEPENSGSCFAIELQAVL